MNVLLSFVLKTLAGLMVLWLALAGIMFFMQDRILYLPNAGSRQILATPDDIGLLWDEITFSAADGGSLHGWWIPAYNAIGTVIFFHGNAGNISHRMETLSLLNALDLNVFIFDYRGYGQSGGRPNEEGITLDAEAAWKHVTAGLGIPADRVILFGRSLGGSIAARLAAQSQPAPAALIIESTFTSVPDLGAQLYPFLPVRLLARNHHNTLQYVGESTIPVLVAHSPDDRTIPWEHGRRLFATAGERGTFLEMRGDHNDGFLVSGQDYVDGLRRFITGNLR